jgi:signal transduction histidine kinase
LLAVAAGVNLWLLLRLYRSSMHAAAAQTLLNRGELIARQLADQPAVQAAAPGEASWGDVERLVRSMHKVEPGLYYVSVTQRGEILFHRQMAAFAAPAALLPATNAVRIDRRLLGVDTGVVPVLTFTIEEARAGPKRSVQVAIRKDAVEREESAAANALGAMFRVALATLAGAFATGVFMVAWIFHRDRRRQERRRQEEHLAFAGALADGVIHDVRNPLSSLRLDIQMLAKEAGREADCRPARLIELAERARLTMDRVDAVMREFLYVSQPDPRVRETFDMNACVRDCQDLLAPRFEQAGITLKTELGALPFPVRGYPTALKRALVNLLENAREAAPAGSAVAIQTTAARDAAQWAVEDAGPGVPPAERERIFTMFYSTRPGGTGLGLSLARAAVEKCGGTIRAEERPGGGTRMVVKLPFARPERADTHGGTRTHTGH